MQTSFTTLGAKHILFHSLIRCSTAHHISAKPDSSPRYLQHCFKI